MFAKWPLVTLFISNLTRLTAVVCMKVRFEAKVTRGFSLSPRRFRNSLSPLRGLLLISFAKKNQEKPLGPGYQTPCITNWPSDFSSVCLPDWLTMSEQTVLRTNWLTNYLTGPNWLTVDLRWAVVVVVVGTYTAPTSIPRGIPMYIGYFSSYHTSSSVPHGISLNAR